MNPQKTMTDLIPNTDTQVLNHENLICQQQTNKEIILPWETKEGDAIVHPDIAQQKIIDPEILFKMATLKDEGKTKDELYSFLRDNGLNDRNSRHVLDTLDKFIKKQRNLLIAGILIGVAYFWVLIYFRIGGFAPWMLMGIPTSMVFNSLLSPDNFKKITIYEVNE